jgi:PAS domain S-box-containing protein
MAKSPDISVSAGLLDRLIKGAAGYALILISPEEKLVYWNEGAERIFGYSEAEMIGRDFSVLFTPEDIENRVPKMELGKAKLEGCADDERWHYRKNGEKFWANGVVNCLKDNTGMVIGYSKGLRDQTNRKRTEDRLKSSVSQLTQFNFMAAHDLQEPLRTVSSYLQLLKNKYDGKIGADHDEYVGLALAGARRMQALLKDLLNYVQSERRDDLESAADCSAILDTAVSNLKVLIEETGAVVTRTPLPLIEASPPQLLQVFQNLVSNGIKYRRPNTLPKIFVDVKIDADNWVFSIADNGIGIPQKDWDEVFLAFKRLHSKDEYPGTGLGLFICKKIIEAHGGRIWIESEVGKGTTFYIALPRKHQTAKL